MDLLAEGGRQGWRCWSEGEVRVRVVRCGRLFGGRRGTCCGVGRLGGWWGGLAELERRREARRGARVGGRLEGVPLGCRFDRSAVRRRVVFAMWWLWERLQKRVLLSQIT